MTSREPSVARAVLGAETGASGGVPGADGSSGRGGGGGGAAFTPVKGAARRAVTIRSVAGSAAGCAITSMVRGLKVKPARRCVVNGMVLADP
jgi:hypothetical protein